MRKRATAIIDVLLAFAFVHIAYRSLKQFTGLGRWEGAVGLNSTPGLVMILFTVSVLLLRRRSFEVYGLTLKRWRYNLNVGLLWVVLVVVLAGLGLMLTRVHFDPAHPHNDMAGRLAGAVFCLITTILLVWMFKRQRTFLDRIPLPLGLLLMIALLSVPVVVAAYFHGPLLKALLTVGWLFLGAGFGEEAFFRGYIQSRIDEAFGRPFRFLGLDFGLGLGVSSLLFGFLHALNTVDYFHGHFDFAWWYGVQSCFTGLFYGCLRQETGSIIAGGVTHGLTDVLAGVPYRF